MALALLWCAVLVGVLIFVHELGHFAVAKVFGVKVLRFSLGFGPKIVGARWGETEYMLAAIPFGGYVELLGEAPTDTYGSDERGRAYLEQALWKRTLIVVAGPLMNLAFPLLLYFVVFLGDREMPPAIVGTVVADSPAESRVLPLDRIVEIDGTEVTTWYEVERAIAARPGESVELVLDRGGTRVVARVRPDEITETRWDDLTRTVGRLDFGPYHPLAVIGVTSPTQAAAAAGLRTFDRVIAAGGRPVERYVELERVLERNRGSMLPITYLRPQHLERALHGLGGLHVYEPHVATLTPEGGPGSGPDRAGLESSDLYVASVIAGSPEHRAGIRPGDRLLALDGRRIRSWYLFENRDLPQAAGRTVELTWKRGDQEITRSIEIEPDGTDRVRLGIDHWAPQTLPPPVSNPAPIWYAVRESVRMTWDITELTVRLMARLLSGRLPLSEIGGPLAILALAGQAASEGAFSFVTLMAVLSVNLGLLNLLPIPMLDGGQLLFFTIETATRRPLSKKARETASVVGWALLIMLMMLAFANDIAHWQMIADTFESAG